MTRLSTVDGKDAYLALNDEFTYLDATSYQPTRDDFDPAFVEAADRYADDHHLPRFDQLRDVDHALRLVEELDR